MYWNNTCGDNHWFWFWPVGFFVFLFLVFGLSRMFWWRGGWRHSGYRYGDEHQDALAILKKRYASGEITKEQFDKIKRELSN